MYSPGNIILPRMYFANAYNTEDQLTKLTAHVAGQKAIIVLWTFTLITYENLVSGVANVKTTRTSTTISLTHTLTSVANIQVQINCYIIRFQAASHASHTCGLLLLTSHVPWSLRWVHRWACKTAEPIEMPLGLVLAQWMLQMQVHIGAAWRM